MDQIRDLRRKQFYMMDDEYLNGYARLCGISATGVYMSLCRHANKEQQCWPQIDLVAKELAISSKTVTRAIKKLEQWGIVITERGGNDPITKRKVVNVYTLIDKSFWVQKPGDKDPEDARKTGVVQGTLTTIFQGTPRPRKETQREGNTYSQKNKTISFFTTQSAREEMLKECIARNPEHENTYRSEMEAFVEHWIETTPDGKRQRWEIEKTFDVSLRFKKWLRNYQKWNR